MVERLNFRSMESDLLCSSLPQLSPSHLLRLMAISIFLAEAGVMFLLSYVPQMSVYFEALLDASALLIILSPTFFFFHYRPLMVHYRERREIVERLCNSEERLNLAMNAVNDGLWDWNVLTGEVYASVRSATMLGFQPGELGDRIEDWGERLHPDDRDEVDRLFKEHLEGGSEYYTAEHRLRHKDGHYIWVLGRGRVVSRSLDNRPRRMIGTYTDITKRKQVEEALRRSEEDIRSLSRVLMLNSEKEKKHLARDLHDEFGQVLSAFQLGVEMLRDHSYGPPEQYEAQCERLLSLVERLEVDLRHMCDHLRPVMLDDLGLVPALQWHLRQFAARHPEVKTSFSGAGLKVHLPQDHEIAIYRICQEALNNIGKYAQASRVEVELQLSTQGLRLSIRDDGIGFSEEQRWRKAGVWGVGLLGMRERGAAAGGETVIESAPGEGTKVEVVLPLQATVEPRPQEVCS